MKIRSEDREVIDIPKAELEDALNQENAITAHENTTDLFWKYLQGTGITREESDTAAELHMLGGLSYSKWDGIFYGLNLPNRAVVRVIA
jgi:hypothetical protein